MVDEKAKSILTWTEWSQDENGQEWRDWGVEVEEKDKYDMAEVAHPMFQDVDETHSNEWYRVFSSGERLKRTRWGRCRHARRTREQEKEEYGEYHTLREIVQVKWAEDDYTRRLEVEEQQKLEAQNLDTVESEEGKQTTDTAEEV